MYMLLGPTGAVWEMFWGHQVAVLKVRQCLTVVEARF